MEKIVLAGGSGCIGKALAKHYSSNADEVVILSRSHAKTTGNIRYVPWDARQPDTWIQELEGASLLVNLTGKNVNCRYTQANRKEILMSRLDSTHILGEVIKSLAHPPRLWVQCASATIYRHAEDHPMDEEHGEIGEGFSVDVCRRWESAFQEQEVPGTRKVLLRIGIVLSNDDGAFPRLLKMTKYGLGGKQGNGKQYVSWIHIYDVVRIISWLYKHKNAGGIYNCTSPIPVTNQYMMKALRSACHVSMGLPAPAWLLEAGAWLIGTETELVLKSRWVKPVRLLQEGYIFQFPAIENAFVDLLIKQL